MQCKIFAENALQSLLNLAINEFKLLALQSVRQAKVEYSNLLVSLSDRLWEDFSGQKP